MFKCLGLTLLELLITISVIVLLVGLASPTMTAIQKNIQLKGVVETHYFAFQQARHLAISKRSDITLAFQDGKAWCAGMSDSGDCNCLIVGDCLISGVEHNIYSADYPFITVNNVKFGKDSVSIFDGQRGLSIGHAGSIVFSDGVRQLKLILSNMGRVRICVAKGNVGSYPSC